MQAFSERSPELFLIVGPARSGTTLLQRILAADERIAVPTELFFFNSVVPRQSRDFGQRVSRADLPALWAAIRRHWWLEPLEIDAEAVDEALGEGSSFAWEELYVAVLHAHGAACGRRLVGEKTLSNLHHLGRIRSADPEMRVVFVLRDPRACVVSRLRSRIGLGNVVAVCREWRACVDVVRRHAEDPQSLVVRYEDLVGNTRATLERIFGFLGVDFDERVLEFHRRSTPGFVPEQTHHVNTLRPVFTDSVDAWKTTLSASRRRFVESRLGDAMVEWGYAPLEGGRSAGPLFELAEHVRLPLDRARAGARQKVKAFRAARRRGT